MSFDRREEVIVPSDITVDVQTIDYSILHERGTRIYEYGRRETLTLW